MRVSTSGTRAMMTTAQHVFITERILALPRGTVVVTGGCIGVDALIARVAYESGYLRVHAILPSDHRQVDQEWQRYCHTSYQMPPGTSYRQRDREVVHDGDNLLAFPMYDEWNHASSTGDPRSIRSGTWMTVRIARRLNKPVETFVLDDIPPYWKGSAALPGAYPSGQADSWPRDILMPEQAVLEYSALWKKIEALLPNYSEEARTVMLSLMVDTCPFCWTGNRNCSCWDDS